MRARLSICGHLRHLRIERFNPQIYAELTQIKAAVHQSGTILVMTQRAAANAQESPVARTIRIPASLRKRIAADAERCGRSFEGQVIALLRRHYGEDVDIAPGPAGILALARAGPGFGGWALPRSRMFRPRTVTCLPESFASGNADS